jgi:hypothetical protein
LASLKLPTDTSTANTNVSLFDAPPSLSEADEILARFGYVDREVAVAA